VSDFGFGLPTRRCRQWPRAELGPDAEQRAVHSLREDLASGRWDERNIDLVALDAAELDLRLLVT
jgi:hypothetical protein